MLTSMRRIRREVCAAALLMVVGGCATSAPKPLAFVGAYGQFSNNWSSASRIVERHGFEARRITVDPPSGVEGSIIIHGRSAAAESAAGLIAEDLRRKFGVRFDVKPARVANHSYSDDYLGIYVVTDMYADSAVDRFRLNHTIIPSDEFIAQCDRFAGSLVLLAGGRFNLSGALFDKSDIENPTFVTGEYSRSKGQLELRLQGNTRSYIETEIEWTSEPVARTLFEVINTEPEGDSILDCNFLQDLAVASAH